MQIMQFARWLDICLAIAFFGSISGLSVVFFKVEDEGAKRGKRLISVAAMAGIALVMWSMLTRMTESILLLMISVALFALALALFWGSYVANRPQPLDFAFSKAEPMHLIRHGPYRYMRHPFYTSYLLGWAAGSFSSPNIVTAAVFLVMAIIYLKAARREEKRFLSSALRDAYAAYQKTTFMFFPKYRP